MLQPHMAQRERLRDAGQVKSEINDEKAGGDSIPTDARHESKIDGEGTRDVRHNSREDQTTPTSRCLHLATPWTRGGVCGDSTVQSSDQHARHAA